MRTEPESLNLRRFKKYFMENIAPYFEEQDRMEREFMERIEREGLFINPKPPLKSIDGGKQKR